MAPAILTRLTEYVSRSSASLRDFRMHVLERCAHDPWRERHAAEAFYALLEQELIR